MQTVFFFFFKYNSSAHYPVPWWPTWLKFIQLCHSIQHFFPPSPISSAIRLLIQPSFLPLTSCINSAWALPTNSWSLHIFFRLSQRGGKWSCASISHVLCIFLFYLMWTLCFSPEQQQEQPDDGAQATEGLTLPYFNALLSLNSFHPLTKTALLDLHSANVDEQKENIGFVYFNKLQIYIYIHICGTPKLHLKESIKWQKCVNNLHAKKLKPSSINLLKLHFFATLHFQSLLFNGGIINRQPLKKSSVIK